MLAMNKIITFYDTDSRCDINWLFAFDEEVWEILWSRQNKNKEGEMIFNTSTYLFTSSYSHVTYTAKEDLLSLFLGFLFTESC